MYSLFMVPQIENDTPFYFYLFPLLPPLWLFYAVFLFQTAVSTANAKLALFFDWLFYQPDKDNIMNIGKANLLLYIFELWSPYCVKLMIKLY